MAREHVLFIIDLAGYYKQPLTQTFKDENGRIDDFDHPLVKDVQEWVTRCIMPENLKKFSDAIKDAYEFFPNRVQLIDTYKRVFRLGQSTITTGAITREANSLEEQIALSFNDDEIPLTTPDEVLDSSFDDMLSDSKVLDTRSMLKKYGREKCGKFWMKEAELDDYKELDLHLLEKRAWALKY